jgi:hypothetical protein
MEITPRSIRTRTVSTAERITGVLVDILVLPISFGESGLHTEYEYSIEAILTALLLSDEG